MNTVLIHADYAKRHLLSSFSPTDKEFLTGRSWEELYHQAQERHVPYLTIGTVVIANGSIASRYEGRNYEGVALFKHLRANKGKDPATNMQALKVTYTFINCFQFNKSAMGNSTKCKVASSLIDMIKIPFKDYFTDFSLSPLAQYFARIKSSSRKILYLRSEYVPDSRLQTFVFDALNSFVPNEGKEGEHIGKCQFILGSRIMKVDEMTGLRWMSCAAHHGIGMAKKIFNLYIQKNSWKIKIGPLTKPSLKGEETKD